jgi:hypothetical protein
MCPHPGRLATDTDWLEFQGTVGADRQMLHAEVADAAWMEGCAMSLDRAIAEASQA